MYLFLCDGKVGDCPKTNCFKYGGDCYRTINVRHAINFHESSNMDEHFYVEKVPFTKKIKYGCIRRTILGWMAGFQLKIRLLLLSRF